MSGFDLIYKKHWIGIGYLLVAGVFYLSLTPDPIKIETSISFFDKISHFTAYFFLMFWFAQIYFSTRSRIICVVMFILMGAGIEVLQSFEIERMFEWMDMLANAMGALFAYVVTSHDLKYVLVKLEQKYYKK